MTDSHGADLARLGQEGVLLRRQLGTIGIEDGEIRRLVRRNGASNPFRGVYAVPARDSSERQHLWAAHVHLGPESVAVLTSALTLHGIQGATQRDSPQFAMPPGLEKHQRDGLDIRFWSIDRNDVTDVGGLPATSVNRTLADVARLLPRMQAVAVLDSALHLGFTSLDQFDAVESMMRKRPHCVAGRRRLTEAALGAQSPLETRVRLRASDAGLAPDALQVPIRNTRGELLGYGDMGYELADGSWLIVEADGVSIHELPEALLHDRRRQNAFLASAAAQILRFTWADTSVATYVPSVLRPVLQRGGWRRGSGRP